MNTFCPFCNAPSSRHFHVKDLNNHGTAMQFDYYQCSLCGLVYIFPIPVDLAKYYNTDYSPYNIPSSIEQLKVQAEDVRFRLDMVLKYSPKKGRLLEIGPSYGGFAFLSKQSGFSVDVIERDSECCRFLKDIIGVNVICTDNVQKSLEGLGQYDVIALWHVIEHLEEPWHVLGTLVDHLLPNGIIVISTPNPDSLQFKLFGQFWGHLDAPRHVSLLSIKWLTCFLEKHGVNKIMLTTTDPDGLVLNSYGWTMSLRNIFRQKLFQYVASLIGQLFAKLFIPIERNSLWGNAYTAVFRKK